MPIAYLVRFLYSHRKRGGGGGEGSVSVRNQIMENKRQKIIVKELKLLKCEEV